MKWIGIVMVPLMLIACGDAGALNSTEKGDLDAGFWRYATDPHGSSADYSGDLVQAGIARIAFHRVPRVDAKNNSWVELIYDLPAGSLPQQAVIGLTYQSSTDLVVKLAQLEYGEQGDQSYAHYQAVLPATTGWHSEALSLADFQRPDWTPASSVNKGIVPEHVSAIYLVPDLTDEQGGQAVLKVRAIQLE
ncbi:hypothetical protein [Alkalimonas amylolytica]|uniref:CBM11 domain-containing protein n=1 Tax=Alkalimonas amylolytica TaxID=152573 RepID=A0A1H4EKT4_ALKAM|nr:hypothetical protein [Alkalimonas amylolytica]SEA85477.1 hypothetical protein SAMN04488051_10798 [Alkalimonas amylolytica]